MVCLCILEELYRKLIKVIESYILFSNVFLKMRKFIYLIGLNEHVDYPRSTVAPVDQQITTVVHTRRVIA